jgi:small subunit ribosomal protein S8
MLVTDPIADMLTRIRNANQMKYKEVEVPTSKLKYEIAKILKSEGFIQNCRIEKGEKQEMIVLTLKYGPRKKE